MLRLSFEPSMMAGGGRAGVGCRGVRASGAATCDAASRRGVRAAGGADLLPRQRVVQLVQHAVALLRAARPRAERLRRRQTYLPNRKFVLDTIVYCSGAQAYLLGGR